MPAESVILVVSPAGAWTNRVVTVMRRHANVRTVAKGLQALARIRIHPPSLVILRHSPPDIEGFEILRQINADEGSRLVPVLFVSEAPEEQEEAFRLGAADMFPLHWRDHEAIARVLAYLELGERRAAARSASPNGNNGVPKPATSTSTSANWLSVALQSGKMYGFDWDARTDEVVRSPSCAQVLAGPNTVRGTGKGWFHRIHPDDVERLRGVLGLLSPAYDAYDTKYRVLRDDGQWITIHESSRGFFDASKRLVRLTGVVIDVSDQVRAELDLAAMQRELLSLIEKLPIAVALTNHHGTIEYINESFRRTFGYDLEEIAKADDWWRLAYPDDDYRREVIAAWERAARKGEADGHDIPVREYRIAAKDRSIHTVRVFGAVLGHRKLVLFDDVTDRRRVEADLRESEERFRLMADTAPIMLWMSGVDKRCTFFNKGWLDFTGHTLDEELGNGWGESVHPEDLDRCLNIYTQAFDARRRFQMEYRLRRADGEYGCVLDTGVARFDSTGAFAGYIGSCLDLTEFKRQHERMLDMQKLESLGVIASGIAHDFNNLLSCILVDAGATVSELEPGSPASNGLRRIEAVAARASEIVQQIMAYAGHEHQEMETVDLPALIRDMLRLLQVCMTKNVQIELHLPNDLPPIRANAPQIRQVVMNLVLNAAEALGEMGGTIVVAANRLPIKGVPKMTAETNLADGDYVCLKILDNGPGMTEDVQKRIFDPFFTTKLQGRGLGLSAVQRIVSGHVGSISVTSELGVGTTFEILLPCEKPGTPVVSISEGVPSEPLHSRNLAVMIVEDEEALRISVAQMLRKRGFTVLEAADGNVAINLIHSQGNDIGVLLLDLTLPGKSSLEVLEQLHQARPDAKVILTSAFGWENVDGRLRALGRDTFIRKPYQVRELISLIRNAILPLMTRTRRHGQSAGA